MPTDSLITVPPLSAQSPVTQINALHAAATELAADAQAKANAATQTALLIGLKLIKLKESTPHGQWEALFAAGQKRLKSPNANHGSHLTAGQKRLKSPNANHGSHLTAGQKRLKSPKANHSSHLINFDSRTALKYIAVTTEVMARKLTALQSAALIEIGNETHLTGADKALLDEVTPPESLRQLYLQLGIIKPTRMELRAMEDTSGKGPSKKPLRKNMTLSEQAQARYNEARDTWFGSIKPGCYAAASFIGTVIIELKDPARGNLQFLKRDDLLELSERMSSILKVINQLAKDL